MKIYTRTGDDGTTGLFGGGRVSKTSLRVDAYGTLDEANAFLGRARASMRGTAVSRSAGGMGLDEIDRVLERAQSELFTLGAELATPAEKDAKLASKMPLLDEATIEAMERAIDAAESGLPPLQVFILPGGTPAAAELHVARCVVRRAERRAISLAEHEQVRRTCIVYLNRLSDLLFVLARRVNHLAAVDDVPWIASP